MDPNHFGRLLLCSKIRSGGLGVGEKQISLGKSSPRIPLSGVGSATESLVAAPQFFHAHK